MDIQKKAPLILKKKNLSRLKPDSFNNDNMALLRCVNVSQPMFVKEDVIYQSQTGDFMKGEYPDLTILNRLNILANSSRTIAKFSSGSEGSSERTSDDVTKLIGQKNYDTVFSALCSVISQELRVQGILALLTVKKSTQDNSCQTEFVNHKTDLTDTSTQTYETCSDLLKRFNKLRKKIRRPQQKPYVLKGSSNVIKKVVIEPRHFVDTTKLIDRNCGTDDIQNCIKISENTSDKNSDSNSNNLQILEEPVSNIIITDLANTTPKDIKVECTDKVQNNSTFPDLNSILDEDSNISALSCGNISLESFAIPSLLENPSILLNDIEKHTQESVVSPVTTPLTMLDGSQVQIVGKPEDVFHIVTPEILKSLNPEARTKVMVYQAYVDWKLCLQRDEYDMLPIHVAVLNNDVDLLRRQCVVLKNRRESVDIPAKGYLTALHMSLSQGTTACTAVLLQHGANPLLTDEEQRTAVHLAAEMTTEHLRTIIDHCRKHARNILYDNDLWREELETKSDEELAKYLLSHICRIYESQGYNPLMLASRQGHYDNVQILLEADPSTVNLRMPNSGNTALYVAVAATCSEVGKNGNKSKTVDHFLKTVEILVKYGADPAVENNSGSNVNLLCNEFNIAELSILIANTIVSIQYPHSKSYANKDFRNFILIKDESGNVNLQDIKTERTTEKSSENIPKNTRKTEVISNVTLNKSQIISNVTQVAQKKKASEIIICPKNIVKHEESSEKLDLSTIQKAQNVKVCKLLPIASGAGLKKIISVDKNFTSNKIKPNTIIAINPKMIKMSKIDIKSKINIDTVAGTSALSTIESNAANQSTTAKRNFDSKENSRGVPIKKQKRDYLDK
ncbi:uncharacterized protein [Battus philenor]|uniref:uncharacterized protein n=1 Tax=Battus philenor TaxID=42288 RepID=UPI0035D0F363